MSQGLRPASADELAGSTIVSFAAFSNVLKLNKLGLGGGCHWCTEGIFQSLRGVHRVEQGWISSTAPHDAFSEAVIVHYDPSEITADDLIEIHLATHACEAAHPLRYRYRSAVYYFGDDAEARALVRRVGEAGKRLGREPLTQVLPYVAFRESLPEHLDYYRSNPDRPFCQRYIVPKIRQLRRTHGAFLTATEAAFG